MEYSKRYCDVTWETCTLRSWFNGYGPDSNVSEKDYSGNNFIDTAFTATEKKAIKTTTVVNNDNPDYGTEGGINTSDKVFLLSIEEVMNPSYGFTNDYNATETRGARNTAYVGSKSGYDEGEPAWYWLRSPGEGTRFAVVVADNGSILSSGDIIALMNFAIRPALHINLQSSCWSYAGTVSSDGSERGYIGNAAVSLSQNSFTYTGNYIKPAVTVKSGGTTLTKGVDYTLSYSSNKNVGTAKVTITGKGNFVGTITRTFTIKPKGATIKTPTRLTKGFQAKWACQSAKMATTRITGYQVRYSLKSSMAGAKYRLVKGYATTSTKVINLNAKKKYYIQVRTYKTVNGKKYFSAWSAKKSATTK